MTGTLLTDNDYVGQDEDVCALASTATALRIFAFFDDLLMIISYNIIMLLIISIYSIS